MVALTKVDHKARASGIRPSFAVVFHENNDESNIVCATRHQVKSDNTLSLGRVMSASQISKTFAELNTGLENKALSCLPDTVLCDSREHLIWYKRRFIGAMWFRMGSKPECLTVEWPPLLFIGNKVSRQLFIYALSSNARPKEKSRIYHAPLMNIDDEGLLCQGTASLPSQISIDSIAQCENTLLDSQFTHTNHDFTLRGKTSNTQHFKYWKGKSKKRTRPVERVRVQELKYSNQTLGDLMRGLK